jgi:predicted O-methyltransferase YrrM
MPIAFPDSISPEAGLLIHALVRNIQPRVVVEVGAFVGISAHWIAAALAEFAAGQPADLSSPPHLHVFDRFDPIRKGAWREAELLEDRRAWIADRLRAADLEPFVTLHAGDSAPQIDAARADLVAAGGVQLAFIDGDHTPAGVLRDFRAIEPALNTGGFILLHDTIPEQCTHTGPRRLLDTIQEVGTGRYEKMDLYSAPLNYGLGLLRRVS